MYLCWLQKKKSPKYTCVGKEIELVLKKLAIYKLQGPEVKYIEHLRRVSINTRQDDEVELLPHVMKKEQLKTKNAKWIKDQNLKDETMQFFE